MSRKHAITALEPGSKRGRVAVHVDGEAVLDLPKDFAAKLGLTLGRSLSPETQEEIRQAAALHEAKLAAVRALGRRALTQADLRRRLLQRGLPDMAVTDTLQWLADLGYLDDEHYAEQRWSALRQRQLGTRGILHTLKSEGVPHELAEEIRARRDDDTQDEAVARQLAEKRNRELAKVAWPQRRQRLYAFLARRGFDGDAIYDALARLELDESSSEVTEEA